jgi:hypothetical protein
MRDSEHDSFPSYVTSPLCQLLETAIFLWIAFTWNYSQTPQKPPQYEMVIANARSLLLSLLAYAFVARNDFCSISNYPTNHAATIKRVE